MKKNFWKAIGVWIIVICMTANIFSVPQSAAAEETADPIRVSCVGDSLTFGYLSSNQQTKSYPSRLQELLGDGYVVSNFGRNSATLLTGTDLAYEDQQVYRDSLASDPDIVIIMLGTNDSKAKYWDAGGRERFAEDARELVTTYKNLPSRPEVIFATSPACLCADKNGIRGNVIEDEIVPVQRQLISENGWKSIDMFALTSGKDGIYHSDGVHFLDCGYYYEAECMYEAVTGEKYLPKALPLAGIHGLTQQTGNEAFYAADDDYGTIWHSSWEPAAPQEDQVLILELKERSLVDGFRYLPRQSGSNGIITQYEIQISNDGGRTYTKAAEGNWEENTAWKKVLFEGSAAATHVKLLAKAGSGGHASAAEVCVDGSVYEPDDLLGAKEDLQTDYEAYQLHYADEEEYEANSWNAFTEKMQLVKKRLKQQDLTFREAKSLSKELRTAVLSLQRTEADDMDWKKAMHRKFYMTENGTILPYRIYLPEGYSADKKYPLVLFLHGAGERGNTNSAQLTNSNEDFFGRMLGPNRNEYPAILIAPQCAGSEQWVDTPWADGCYSLENVAKSDEMEAVEELLAGVMETYSVNQNRLYAVGFSMGAFGVWDLMMRNPDLLAAAVPIAGAGDPAQADKIKDIPIWCFHGEDDPTVPCETSTPVMADALEKAGAQKTRYTQYPAGTFEDGHLIASGVYAEEEFLSWLFAQKIEMDTANLSGFVSSADKKDPAQYTEESYAEFLEALKNAKDVLADDSSMQSDIDEALQKLKDAESKLKEKPKDVLLPEDPVEPEVPPAAPNLLSLSRKTKSITVSWNAVANADGYEALYSASGEGKTVSVAGGAVNSCQIAQTDDKTVYTVRVRAYRETKAGRLYSEYSAWNPQSVSVPKPKFASIKKSGKSVRIKWKKISGASGYKILRKTGKKGKFKVIATMKTGKKVSYPDKKVKSGKKYYYKIRAIVKEGQNTVNGPFSSVKNLKVK